MPLTLQSGQSQEAEHPASLLLTGQQEPGCWLELAGSGIPRPPGGAAGARLPLALDVLSEAVDSLPPSSARAAFLLSPSWRLMGLHEPLQAHQLAGEASTLECSDAQAEPKAQPSASLSPRGQCCES